MPARHCGGCLFPGMIPKSEIRRLMRRRRRGLQARHRRRAAGALCEALRYTPLWREASRIAVFLPTDGEIDVRPLIRLAWAESREVYLPLLLGGTGRMAFARYRPGGRLFANRFRIPEPAGGRRDRVDPRRLDLVLAPLVAFDAAGHRLGMGGGFYDRAFAFLGAHRAWRRPRLMGVAYAFQEIESLPAEPWDVPLCGVATERGLRRLRRVRARTATCDTGLTGGNDGNR